MLAVIATDHINSAIQELNVKGLLSIERLNGSMNHILHTIESEQVYTHIIIDLDGIKGIQSPEDAMNALERLKTTAPSAKLIVIDTQHDPDAASVQDIKDMGIDDVLHCGGALLKRQLNHIFMRENLFPDQNTPVEEVAEPPAPAPAPPETERRYTVGQRITPPSQVPRQEAKQLVSKKTPSTRINRALTIAVAGGGHRIGTTTQAMQLALYLKSHDESVAVMQMKCVDDSECRYNNNLSQYVEIMGKEQATILDEEHFQINGLDLYCSGKSIGTALTAFHYLICDYGDFNSLSDITAFLDKDVKVIVGGVKPWEQAQLKPVFQVDDGKTHYVFTSVLPTDQKYILAQMDDSADKTHFSNYSPDYWSYCGDDEMYSKIIRINHTSKGAPQKRGGLFSLLGGK